MSSKSSKKYIICRKKPSNKKPSHDMASQLSKVKTQLYPHQLTFLKKAKQWEASYHGGLLGAEMGTGKTLMMLALFASSPEPKKTLVIAPVSLLQNWKNEYFKHLSLPSDKVVIYHGAKRTQIKLYDKLMVITSYGTALSDYKKYQDMSPLAHKFQPNRIVLDEAHEIKNSNTLKFQAIENIPARIRWAMTGTPIQNYREDVESLSRFIGHKPYSEDWWWARLGEQEINEWKNDLYIYFSKEDIQLNLPNINYNHHKLPFNDTEQELYDNMKQEAFEIFDDYLNGNTKGIKFTVILTKILRLKQLCNHPHALLNENMQNDVDLCRSTKINKILDIVNKTKYDDKIIIFSQFRGTLSLIRDTLIQHEKHEQYLMYHGGMNPGEKTTVLKQFEHDENKRILLMSLKAGGVGLNLVQANHAILVDPWWNRAIEEQAIARIHRIGQNKEVHIHRISMLNSIEDWIIGLQDHKLFGAENFLYGKEEPPAQYFTKEQLYTLFHNVTY